jgi:hypothetical protein
MATNGTTGAAVVDQASQSPAAAADGDPLPEAISLARAAAEAGLGLKLLGGLAVRVICPDLPPRLRAGQDMDFACLSRGRKDVSEFLARSGCEPDRRFNSLNGDRQMYFTAPSGRPVDLMVDRLNMCHVLDFRPTFGALPYTLAAMDILLSKLQVVELNEKDARDIIQLLAGVPVSNKEGVPVSNKERAKPEGPVLDAERFSRLLAGDWGWWRTVTGNLEKLPGLADDKPELVPPDAPYDPLAQAAELLELARSVPKSMKWKVRAGVGDRVRWYELPEEVGH